MAYTADLESAGFGHEGSSPSARTNLDTEPQGHKQ